MQLQNLIKTTSGLDGKQAKILPSGSLKEKPPCGAKEKLDAAVVVLLTELTAIKQQQKKLVTAQPFTSYYQYTRKVT